MVLTIYAPLFASSKKAVVTLMEKGVEFDTVNDDLMKGEHRQTYWGRSLKRGQVVQWLDVEATSYHPPLLALMLNIVFAPLMGFPADEKVIKESEEKLGEVLDVYEAYLSKKGSF